MKLYLGYHPIPSSLSLYWMLVSRIKLLHPSYISISPTNPLSKHRAINVTTAKAKLFAIQYGINQAVTISNTNHIIIITDSLYVARKIFNFSAHLYKTHSATISQKLRELFSKDIYNYIKFWDCPSKQQQSLHHIVDKETKNMVTILSFPCKSSWDFCKKSECDLILSQQRMIFQMLQLKTLVLVRRRTLYRVIQENSMENSLQDLPYLYTICPGLCYNYNRLFQAYDIMSCDFLVMCPYLSLAID